MAKSRSPSVLTAPWGDCALFWDPHPGYFGFGVPKWLSPEPLVPLLVPLVRTLLHCGMPPRVSWTCSAKMAKSRAPCAPAGAWEPPVRLLEPGGFSIGQNGPSPEPLVCSLHCGVPPAQFLGLHPGCLGPPSCQNGQAQALHPGYFTLDPSAPKWPSPEPLASVATTALSAPCLQRSLIPMSRLLWACGASQNGQAQPSSGPAALHNSTTNLTLWRGNSLTVYVRVT